MLSCGYMRKYKPSIKKEGKIKDVLHSQPCTICGYARYTEICHIVPKRLGYGHQGINILVLCPNHHKLYDYGLLNSEELSKIEHLLIALTEEYKSDMRAVEYLYFQLGLHNPPHWMCLRRNELKKRLPNSRF